MTAGPAPDPDAAAPLDVSSLLESPPAPGATVTGRRLRLWLVIAIPILMVIVVAIGTAVLREARDDLARALAERLSLLAANRVELVNERLDRLIDMPAYVVASDAFRLFATEVDLVADDDPLASQLHDMAGYMTEALSELVRQRGLAAAYLIARDGDPALASGAAPELGPAERAPAVGVFEDGQPRFTPVTRRGDVLELDVYLPVRAVQAPDPEALPEVVGVFMMTVPINATLAEFVAPRDLALPGERTALVQIVGAQAEVIGTGQVDAFLPSDWSAGDQAVEMRVAASALDGRRVFAAAVAIDRVPWRIVEEVDYDIAARPLRRDWIVVLTVAGLFVMTVVSAAIALWTAQANAFNRALASQYRELATRIDAQRRLLDGINESVQEMIGLKRSDGTYAYVNNAFARIVDRPTDQIIGQTDEGVFGHGQAEWLEQADRQAIDAGLAIRAEQRLYIDGRPHYLEISKVPLAGEGGEPVGVVSVARDVTELVEERRRREAGLRHTIDALIKTVEFSDPYLSGHARLVGRVSVLMAQGLALPSDDTHTLEIAANLAQIGKLFVPREILAKPDRLTPDEQKVMERHIEYAGAVLKDIEFGLPVRETIAAMYERLDGSGYPARLQGDAVPPLSRILGLADVFCARIRPRSYRSALDPDEALAVLREHTVGKFGAELIDLLDRMVHTTEGEKLLALARTSV